MGTISWIFQVQERLTKLSFDDSYDVLYNLSKYDYEVALKEYQKKVNVMSNWIEEYSNLDLKNGEIKFICDDDQDMIEIRYDDGMLIDVGYVEEDRKYYITVVKSDDKNGWQNPLEIVEVGLKEVLSAEIQKIVIKYR